jgi:hypothetical protein
MTLALLLAVFVQAPETRLLDGFDRPERWRALPADGVELALRSGPGRTGQAMRFDFAFRSGGGYAIARRELNLDLPPNYAFSFWIRGTAPPNTLEFKLVDRSGENVWWYTERDRTFQSTWEKVTIRRRQISFAWGPKGGADLDHAAALEIVITAGAGGGSDMLWLDDLVLTTLPVMGPYTLRPVISASASMPAHPAAAAIDGDTTTAWRARGPRPFVTLDFLRMREYGGLTLAWETGRAPQRFTIALSDDGRAWRRFPPRPAGLAGRDQVYLPDTESRYLRVEAIPASSGGIGLREVIVHSLEWSASRNVYLEAVARDAPRGAYPRYLRGERGDWTVVGVDKAVDEALLGEDGALEAGSGAFSLEPFLLANGRWVSWNDVETTLSLEQGRLPIPTVEWRSGGTVLRITAFAAGTDSASSAVARYRVRNEGSGALRGTFYVAIRPFQVNPPWQFLGTPGGAARVDSMRWDAGRMAVGAGRLVVPLTRPTSAGVTAFASGDIVEHLRRGTLPRTPFVHDGFGAASGALGWALDLAPGDSSEIAVEVPLRPGRPPLLGRSGSRGADSALQAAARTWASLIDRATITLPATDDRVARVIASTIAYILINRDGPAIQPGSRSYERSWIRDGALTSAALLRFGHHEPVRDFLLWFAGHQYPNGKVPCCVDRRGADPVPEHDSHGQLIYLAAELYRHTGDRETLAAVWPRLVRAAAYIDSLRQSRRTPEYESSDKRHFFGLLPPSISHEGYSAKPMHSYWDDFFALRGLKDAAFVATILGHTAEAARFGAMAEEFARELYASIDRAMAHHRIDFIPGAADLGDFDATSTTIAVSPGGELERLPRAALERTFDRYWEQVQSRRAPGATWDAYTPYELRTVGTMLRLGRKDRALALLDGFLRDQTPPEWNQWPEVVWREPRAPKFVGDVPHTWVGSDFLRSAADLLAYERESDSALVIAAGVPDSWLEGTGLAVSGLSTWWGRLSYRASRADGRVTLTVDSGLRLPPGGLVIHRPGIASSGRVLVNGQPAPADSSGAVRVRALPATVRFER